MLNLSPYLQLYLPNVSSKLSYPSKRWEVAALSGISHCWWATSPWFIKQFRCLTQWQYYGPIPRPVCPSHSIKFMLSASSHLSRVWKQSNTNSWLNLPWIHPTFMNLFSYKSIRFDIPPSHSGISHPTWHYVDISECHFNQSIPWKCIYVCTPLCVTSWLPYKTSCGAVKVNDSMLMTKCPNVIIEYLAKKW